MNNRAGTYRKQVIGGEPVRTFFPNELPPDPPLQLSNHDLDLLSAANRSLGRLDGLSSILPDASLFLYWYVRKEAVLSSQIEGTQSSFSDLVLSEHDGALMVPTDDVREVSNYVAAMNYGLERLAELPLSLRLIREIHGVLLRNGRGASKTPGEFRRTQNWIGGSRPGNATFVPPPPDMVIPSMGALESFLHDQRVRTPLLLKAALAHAQFESIHPFLDGNGRLGRLLVTFLLCSEGALQQPILYLSLFFKRHRDTYYGLLQRVRDEGAWEEWVRFFLQGVHETADQAVETAKRILSLLDTDRAQINAMGPKAGSLLRVHTVLQSRLALSVAEAASLSGVSDPTARTALRGLMGMKIVKEVTGKKRDQVFVYEQYVRILNDGTELPSS